MVSRRIKKARAVEINGLAFHAFNPSRADILKDWVTRAMRLLFYTRRMEGREFRGQVMTLDGLRARNCRFIGVTFIYHGGSVYLEDCRLQECNTIFCGKAENAYIMARILEDQHRDL